MYKRLITLPKHNSFFLFGARQTGKSTMIEETFGTEDSKTIYLNLLEEEVFNQYSKNLGLLREEIEAKKPDIKNIIIDEVQRIPGLLNEVHAILFKEKNKISFCLSGSSARKLKSSGANLLAGRAWTYNLFPLTHIELGKHFSLSKVLRYGSLPSIAIMQSEQEIQKTLRAYVTTYLQEEIQRESEIRNYGAFLRFLQVASDLNGSLINYSDIGRDSGVSYVTAKGYFKILEDTLLGNLLLPYSGKTLKRLKRAPKFYFFDLGVKRAIDGKLTTNIEPQTSEYGSAFEHFLINEIVHLSKYKENDYTFSFYRTHNDAEVDLIVNTPQGECYAIEIKSGDSPGPSAFSGLKSFQEVRPKAHLICACTAKRDAKRGDVLVKPWQEVIKLLKLY